MTAQRTFGTFLLVIWIGYALLTLLPVSPMNMDGLRPDIRETISAHQGALSQHVYVTYLINLAMGLVGIGGGVMALKNTAAWRPVVLLASAVFVVDWWLTSLFVESDVTVRQAIVATWIRAPGAHFEYSEIIRGLRLVSRDYVLFIIHHAIVAVLGFTLLRRYALRGDAGSHPAR